MIRSMIAACLLAFAATPAPASTVREALQPYVQKGSLAGAVAMVVTADRTVSLDTLGYADLATRRPLQADAVFWIASMSKPITTSALMMLVDEGRVDLDAPVSRYLPGFGPRILTAARGNRSASLRAPSRPITVRDVLRHTSGLPFTTSIETDTRDRLPLAANVASYSLIPLLFEPGSDYLYSNAGINVAGRIIEVVSGMPYERFLEARLFKPLGMAETGFWPTAAQVARLPNGYWFGAKSVVKPLDIMVLVGPLPDRGRRHPVPGGGLFSTTADIARFCQFLLADGVVGGKRLLSSAALAEMRRDQMPDAVKARQTVDPTRDRAGRSYGLGFQLSANGRYGHQGARSTSFSIDPQRRAAYIFMTQAIFQDPDSQPIAAFERAAERAIDEETAR